MPVRSLSSPVLKWPNKQEVEKALRHWIARTAPERPDLLRLGYFGSYANGRWGVGSDLDLVAVVTDSSVAPRERPLSWDLSDLPVPTEIQVYTAEEWAHLQKQSSRFARMLDEECVWVYSSDQHSE